MGSELRVGLVGCGRVAERGHVPALRRAKGLRLAAVADPELSRCAKLAPELPRYESAADLIADGAVDALVLATPAAAHLADARLAAEAGLPALVEKPPAATAEEAAAMAALDPAPWIGFNRRFEPGLARLRSKVPAEGGLDLSIELHHPTGSWGSYVVSDDTLAASGTHLIDLARWLTRSEIERVEQADVEPTRARADLVLARGRASISCMSGARHRDRVEVRQAEDLVVAYRADGPIRRILGRLARPTATALVALQAAELGEFASAARGGHAPSLATAADGLAVMSAMEAIRAAGTAPRSSR